MCRDMRVVEIIDMGHGRVNDRSQGRRGAWTEKNRCVAFGLPTGDFRQGQFDNPRSPPPNRHADHVRKAFEGCFGDFRRITPVRRSGDIICRCCGYRPQHGLLGRFLIGVERQATANQVSVAINLIDAIDRRPIFVRRHP